MRGRAMKKVVAIFQKEGIDLSKMRALEVFSRDGSWQTICYADKVKSLDAWEINPIYIKKLKINLPKANIKKTNSIEEIKKKSYKSKYNFIVIDNPQGCFGVNNEYCEHFDIIPHICTLLHREGILVFNINKNPFSLDNFPEWKKRRALFYGRKRTNKLSIKWLLAFYKKIFYKEGYEELFSFSISRGDFKHNDYLHYLVYYLKGHREMI